MCACAVVCVLVHVDVWGLQRLPEPLVQWERHTLCTVITAGALKWGNVELG